MLLQQAVRKISVWMVDYEFELVVYKIDCIVNKKCIVNTLCDIMEEITTVICKISKSAYDLTLTIRYTLSINTATS